MNRNAAAVLVVRRVERLLRHGSFGVALLKALSRFLTMLGVLMLLGWSYSLWGSAESPMRILRIPGLVLLAGGWILAIILGKALSRVRFLLKQYLRSLEEERRSRIVRRIE